MLNFKKNFLIVFLFFIISLPMQGFIKMPRSIYSIGPSLGYSFSDTLGGPTISFDLAKTYHTFSYSIGGRYILKNDRGFNGLLSAYVEFTLPLVGIGASYNFALGAESGFGLNAFFYIPIPVGRDEHLSIYYRPAWIWFGKNVEIINEWGVYYKFTNLYRQSLKDNERKYNEMVKKFKEQKKKSKKKYKEDALFK